MLFLIQKKQRSQVTLITTGGDSTKHMFPGFMWTNKGDELTLLKAENVPRRGEHEGFVQEGVVLSLLQFR